ncbi:SAP domain-containing protein [bacterium]|nr:SAP domain-containing protein [bacterium]MBU1754417.1 SAP domain-containing protein [bacterium]
MKLNEIKNKAKGLEITPGKMKKENLIREIQREEGNFECFGMAVNNECDQEVCCWREDCLK